MFVFVFNEQRQHWMEIYFPPTVVVLMPPNKEFCVSTLLWLVDGSMEPLTVPYTHTHAYTHERVDTKAKITLGCAIQIIPVKGPVDILTFLPSTGGRKPVVKVCL